MTNEELAVRIQRGDKTGAFRETLYEQTQEFLRQQVRRYITLYPDTCTGAGFLALRDAINAFDTSQGYKLPTYMHFPLKTHYRTALGIRTSRRDPLATAARFKKPIGGGDDLTHTQIAVMEGGPTARAAYPVLSEWPNGSSG